MRNTTTMNRLILSLLLLLLLSTQAVQSQAVRYIKGKVYERVDGKTAACPGVNVYIANDQNRSLIGTTTNVNGEYSLKVPTSDGKLKVDRKSVV